MDIPKYNLAAEFCPNDDRWQWELTIVSYPYGYVGKTFLTQQFGYKKVLYPNMRCGNTTMQHYNTTPTQHITRSNLVLILSINPNYDCGWLIAIY